MTSSADNERHRQPQLCCDNGAPALVLTPELYWMTGLTATNLITSFLCVENIPWPQKKLWQMEDVKTYKFAWKLDAESNLPLQSSDS
jgi:hypothetical protein